MESPRRSEERPLRLALGTLSGWARTSPAAWIAAVALASLWPLLDHASGLGLLPDPPAGTEFGQLAGIGSMLGTLAGLSLLAGSPAAVWLLSRRARWLAEAQTLTITAGTGAVLAGTLPALETGGDPLPVLGLVLNHAFLGLFVHRTWPLAARAPMAFLGLAWLLPALAPAALQPATALLIQQPQRLPYLPALLPLAVACGWLLISTHPRPAARLPSAGASSPNP